MGLGVGIFPELGPAYLIPTERIEESVLLGSLGIVSLGLFSNINGKTCARLAGSPVRCRARKVILQNKFEQHCGHRDQGRLASR